jgi:hypothetical protein
MYARFLILTFSFALFLLDMSVFNVEVDPKAIEAAAKDVPPEYIPTDGVDGELAATNADSPIPDENTAPLTAAAVATAAAIAATNATENNNNNTDDPLPTSNLDKWKEMVTPGDEHDDEDEEIDFPDPSMDDFFHEEEH